MAAIICEFTPIVLTLKFVDVWPCGTETEVGTFAVGSLLASDTNIPLVPAGLLIVTVPVDVVPPGTVVGSKLIPIRLGGLMVKVAT
jgi:hypothetical protein